MFTVSLKVLQNLAKGRLRTLPRRLSLVRVLTTCSDSLSLQLQIYPHLPQNQLLPLRPNPLLTPVQTKQRAVTDRTKTDGSRRSASASALLSVWDVHTLFFRSPRHPRVLLCLLRPGFAHTISVFSAATTITLRAQFTHAMFVLHNTMGTLPFCSSSPLFLP